MAYHQWCGALGVKDPGSSSATVDVFQLLLAELGLKLEVLRHATVVSLPDSNLELVGVTTGHKCRE